MAGAGAIINRHLQSPHSSLSILAGHRIGPANPEPLELSGKSFVNVDSDANLLTGVIFLYQVLSGAEKSYQNVPDSIQVESQ